MAATVAAHAGVASLAARCAPSHARCRTFRANGVRNVRAEATGRGGMDASYDGECRRERHEVDTPSTSSLTGRAFGALAAAVAPQVAQMRQLLFSRESRERERVWLGQQTQGELDEVLGQYRRRVEPV